jgi:hypothetical protein
MVPGNSTKPSLAPADRFTPALKTTVEHLDNWVATATPGGVLEYFRGHLAVDRVAPGSRLGREASDELDRVADAAMALAQAGRVHLVQRRHGDGDYSYFLILGSSRLGHAT